MTRLSQFLGVSAKDIGRIGGGAHKANGRIDVAVIQTFSRMEDEFLAAALKGYGQVIVDECHAISAPTFERIAHASPARYFLGLSATVVRNDGQHPIIEMECGPIRYRVDSKKMDSFASFRHVVRVRPTPFVPKTGSLESEGEAKFADMVAELVNDKARNAMIARDVAECVREGRSPVVISERRDHLDMLEELLREAADHVIVLRGGIGRKTLRALREEMDSIPDRISVKASTMRGSTRCSLHCRYRGRAGLCSTPGGFTDSTTASGRFASTTISTNASRCARRCSTAVPPDTAT